MTIAAEQIQQTEKRIQRCYELWRPSLLELQERYQPTAFPGVFALLGVLNGLWPQWVQGCQEDVEALGQYRHFQAKQFDFAEPWLGVYNPLDIDIAWVLVQAEGLGNLSEHYQELQKSDMVLSLQTLQENGELIVHGDALQILTRWGILRSNKSSIHIPMIDCDQLAEDWPTWRESLRWTEEEVKMIARINRQQGKGGRELQRAFLEVAAQLWQAMLQDQLLLCAPFRGDSFFRYLGLLGAPKQFNGVLILRGDHQKLWRLIASLS